MDYQFPIEEEGLVGLLRTYLPAIKSSFLTRKSPSSPPPRLSMRLLELGLDRISYLSKRPLLSSFAPSSFSASVRRQVHAVVNMMLCMLTIARTQIGDDCMYMSPAQIC